LRDGQWPVGALRWFNTGQRGKLLYEWRKGIWRTFPRDARVLRIAWALEYLFVREGYAFVSNPRLASDTAIDLKKLERALKLMADKGVIIRGHVGPQRRIFPAIHVIGAPAVTGGTAPAVTAPQHPPSWEGHKLKKNAPPLTSTQNAARQYAQCREARTQPRAKKRASRGTVTPRNGALPPAEAHMPPTKEDQ
jgi:hypothetical protein